MAKKLISYFENLSSDENKLPFERTVNSKSGEIKKLATDFTEIKRSSHEWQVLDNKGLYVRAKAIDKSLRVSENEYVKRHAEVTKQILCKKDEELSQTYTNSYTTTNETGSDDKEEKTDVTVNSTSHVVSDVYYRIKRNTEEFEKKRSKQQSEYVKSLVFQSQDENSVEEHLTQEEICDSFHSFDSEDIFGLNDFSDDYTDNYILQSYNDYGRELIKTQLEFRNTTLSANDVENLKIDELLEYPNSVFYPNTRQNDGVLEDFSQLVENSPQDEHLPNNVNFIDTPKEEVDNESHFFDSDIYEEIDGCAKNISEQSNNYNTAIIERNSSLTNYRLQNEQIQGDNLYHNLHDLQKHDSDDIFLDNQNLLKRKSEKKEKISYVINELIKTEELYISDLKTVVKKYLPHFYSKIENSSCIFGNIEKIYEAAKVFLKLLKKCDQNADEIAKVFIKCSDSFDLYPQYFKNKPTANSYLIEFDTIAKERQMELKDNLPLASYLLTPIQRLGKYVLLLENIQKELSKTDQTLDSVNSAINIIRNVLQKGDDYIAIDSIKQCKIQLTKQGSFIMRANFNILKPRKFRSMVFLFDEVIVFTEETAKNTGQFNYFHSIQMSDLGLSKLGDNSFEFSLKDHLKKNASNHNVVTYVLVAKDLEIKNNWTMAIEEKLWYQFQKAKEQQKQKMNFEAGEGSSKVPLQRGSIIIQEIPDKKEKPPKPKSKFSNHIGTLTKNVHIAFQPFSGLH